MNKQESVKKDKLVRLETEKTSAVSRISPKTLWEALSPVTYQSIYESPNKALSGIVRDLGKEAGELYVKALLTLAIIDLTEFFNIQGNMTEGQVVNTVNLIREKYWMLKPDDFKLCFKRVMSGDFGKVYNRLDGHVIMEWLDKYVDERSVWFYDYQSADHRKISSEYQRNMEERERTRSAADEDYSMKVSEYISEKFKNENRRDTNRNS